MVGARRCPQHEFVLLSQNEEELQRRLTALHPGVPWEVTNQATVHTWFESTFGYPVPPLLSLEDAVASWPEFATCVGLTVRENDTIDVIAPYALDLFAMVIRRNPARVSVDMYQRRIAQKQYQRRWPQVTLMPQATALDRNGQWFRDNARRDRLAVVPDTVTNLDVNTAEVVKAAETAAHIVE